MRTVLALLLVFGLFAIACNGNGDSSTDDPTNERVCNEPEPSPPDVEGETFTTEGGVQVIIIDSDKEDPSRPGDAVAIHYTGWLTADGTMFESSLTSCKTFTFVLERGDVIRGWDEGIVGMSPGDIRRLIIPAAIAYGEQGSENVPPNSGLTFDVELLAFGRRTDPTPTP